MILRELAIELPALRDEAKALWGDEKVLVLGIKNATLGMSAWQYHLRQMIVSDDPVKYLKEHSQ